MADEESEKFPSSSDSSEHVRSASILPGAFFITGVTFASIVGGFGYAIGQARRRSPQPFDARTQEGVKLAVKALGWGTVLAVSGVGLLILGVKTALGVRDVRVRFVRKERSSVILNAEKTSSNPIPVRPFLRFILPPSPWFLPPFPRILFPFPASCPSPTARSMPLVPIFQSLFPWFQPSFPRFLSLFPKFLCP